MKYFFPILFLEVYLIMTLALFEFGPVNFYVDQPILFWGFMIIYLLSFIIGYFFAYLTKKKVCFIRNYRCLGDELSISFFWILMTMAIFASVISFRSISIFEIVSPDFWVRTLVQGVSDPGAQYLEKIDRMNSGDSENKVLSIILFLVAFSRIIFIPVLVFLWHRLGTLGRSLGFIVTLVPVLNGIYNGTNKYIFDFFIFYFFSLLIYFIYMYRNFGIFNFRSRKFFMIIFLVSFFGAFSFFGLAMQFRGGGYENIESASSRGDIFVSQNWSASSNESMLNYTFIWFSSYLVQGYYGFSLSLSEDFSSTFGVGNSAFLSRQFEWILGVDVSSRTYQHKIDPWWGESSRWHSFYSYFANDFHFIGVSFVCFFLGYLLARLWFSFLDFQNVYAAMLLPLFGLLIIFIPANNQVFGFLETFSAFSIGLLLWGKSKLPRNCFERMLISPSKDNPSLIDC